jgi:transcriptional regulator with XRE-family HTH domain
MTENKKKPNPIDIHVGSRIRLRRTMLGMSQEKLGESLGITFQQIQKYEKGTNRVGASRLQNIAGILNVPVSFFFEDAPGDQPGSATGAEASVLLRRSATQPRFREDF